MDKDILHSILRYNRKTGVFTWKAKTSRKTVIGAEAGGIDCAGYRVIGYNGKTYYAHRLAWLYCHGYWPKQIDHKDGNRANNSINNLRECSHAQNIYNAKKAKNNSSGYKGVSWHRSAGKWEAYICADNRKQYLGLFDSAKEASNAYLDAVKKIEPEYVRSE